MSGPSDNERLRVVVLTILRGASLSDHIGDMWRTLEPIAEALGIEVPTYGDDDEPDCDALEAMGALSLYGGLSGDEPNIVDYIKGKL